MSIFNKQNKNPDSTPRPFVSAVIAAAGNATRMGGVNKQLLLIDSVPVLIRSISAFSECDYIDEIIVAAREQDIPDMYAMIKDYGISKVKKIVSGGETRQQSVVNAIKACSENARYFAIHDGARPLVSAAEIENTILAAFECGAAATAVRVKDTVKIADENGVVVSTPDRSTLWAVQTPQVFERQLYVSALEAVDSEGVTDDCMLVERYGASVRLVEGSYDNIKITTPSDAVIAECILRGQADD